MQIETNLKKAGSEFWNANPCGGEWSSYGEFMDWIIRTEPYIFHVLDRYDWQGKQVLEVGCGQGTTLNYVPRLGACVYGVDMSAISLAQARAGALELGHANQVNLSICDAENLHFPDQSFDAVVCVGVLHHTEDTQKGVREFLRVLKPDGVAIVMLYRTGNPKWWGTRFVRGLSSGVDRLMGRQFFIADQLRRRQQPGSSQGTALLELFGVRILKAFSNEECRRMFSGFSSFAIANYQAGFERNCDILPILQPFRKAFRWLDTKTQDFWGFYQVIEARK